MAQQCTIQEDEKLKQLRAIAVSVFRSNIGWTKYLELCELDQVDPKNLFVDTSYYAHVDKIETKHVRQEIKKATEELYQKAKEDPEKRDAKRPAKGVKCNNCNSNKTMNVTAHSKDASTITFPSGIHHDGYFPDIPNLCSGDDLDINVCLNCGFLVGFEKKEFNDHVMKAEYLGDY